MKKFLTILCVLLMVFSLAACGDDATEPTDATVDEENTSDTSEPEEKAEIDTDGTSEPESEESESVEQVIYEDDTLKATYMGISETAGMVILNVSLENKTDEEISVLPMDSSVDDEMVQFLSGTMATMQGGKTFNQGWIIGTMPTERVEFSLLVCDEDMAELVQTDILTVEVE